MSYSKRISNIASRVANELTLSWYGVRDLVGWARFGLALVATRKR